MQNATGIHGKGLSAQAAYSLAGLCLALGLVIGYFFVGARSARSVAPAPSGSSATAPIYPGGHPKLTLEQMKQMADMQASTLLQKSKSEPKNAALQFQIAKIYQGSHQFKEAAAYFEQGLKFDPKNVPARTELASCLFYANDVDGALAQLNQALKYAPKDTNALFNLGMIKYRGKGDTVGAIAAWQQLLTTNPDLDRRPMVEQLIAEAKSAPAKK